MKRIIIITFFIFQIIQLKAQDISFPINRAVFQRNGKTASAVSTVTFAGQVIETSNNSTYEIRRLKFDGTDLGAYQAAIVFSSSQKTRVGTSNVYTFHFTRSIPTGWYQLKIKNGSNNVIKSVKFGVGEVFVIAGQSNAQGYGQSGYGYSQVNNNYDCVGSLKNVQAISTDGNSGGVGTTSDFINLERPVFGALKYTTDIANLANNNPWIGPNATRTWYYLWLGENLAKMHGNPANTTSSNYTTQPPVPIMFYNVASAATSINNWEGAMKVTEGYFINNYINKLDISQPPLNNLIIPSPSSTGGSYPEKHPWQYDVSYDKLYTVFKNVLSFYGGMFGVRAVIWHQGEAETKTLLNIYKPNYYTLGANSNSSVPVNFSAADYNLKLKSIIDESRQILPDLKWVVLKASLTSEPRASNSTIFEQNIINDYSYSGGSGQSWVYSVSGTSIGITPFMVNTANTFNVVKQQELVQQNNSSYVTLSMNTDTYSTLPQTYYPEGFRQSDKTHFNGNLHYILGLNVMQTTAAGSAIFSQTPVLPVSIPKLVITGTSANYTINLIAPTGVSYVSRQWYTSISTKFNQSLNNSTSNGTMGGSTSSITGFVKDNVGRISIIPFCSVSGAPGARIAEQHESTVYPNPTDLNQKDINIALSPIKYGKEIKVELLSERGELLYQKNYKSPETTTGKIVVKYLDLPKIDFGGMIYVKIISSDGSTDTKRLIIEQ